MGEPDATNLQEVLRVSARVASVLAAPPPEGEIKQWFEDGRLPCSLSLKLLWEPILAQLDDLDRTLINKRNAINNEQIEKLIASHGVSLCLVECNTLRVRLLTSQSARY